MQGRICRRNMWVAVPLNILWCSINATPSFPLFSYTHHLLVFLFFIPSVLHSFLYFVTLLGTYLHFLLLSSPTNYHSPSFHLLYFFYTPCMHALLIHHSFVSISVLFPLSPLLLYMHAYFLFAFGNIFISSHNVFIWIYCPTYLVGCLLSVINHPHFLKL